MLPVIKKFSFYQLFPVKKFTKEKLHFMHFVYIFQPLSWSSSGQVRVSTRDYNIKHLASSLGGHILQWYYYFSIVLLQLLAPSSGACPVG